MLAHWDEVEGIHRDKPPMGATWQRLGDAAGAQGIGVNRVRCGPSEDLQQLYLRVVKGAEHYVLDRPSVWMIFPIALRMSAAACAATAWSCGALAVAEWASSQQSPWPVFRAPLQAKVQND